MRVLHHLVAAAMAGLLAGCGGGGGGGGATDAQSGSAPPATADYFPLDVGSGWSYGDGSTARVLGSVLLGGQQAVQIRTDDGNGTVDEYYQKTDSAVTVVPGGDADDLSTAVGPVTLLRLPLRAGDKYVSIDRNLDGRFDLDGDGLADNLSVRSEVSVIDIATLVTASGSMPNTAHVRTVLTQTARSSATGQTGTTILTSDDWYAPGVGPVKNSTVFRFADGSTTSTSQEIRHYHVGNLRSAHTPAAVAATFPASGTVGSSGVISVVFGEDMDTLKTTDLGLTVSDAGGQPVAGQAVWDDRRTLRFQPAQALGSGSYSVRLTPGAENLAGNTVAAPLSWDFRLDKTGPVVVGLTPAEGAGEVALDTSIRVTFDEPVDLASAQSRVALVDERSFVNVPADLTLDGNAIVLKPKLPLSQRSTYAVTVSAGVADVLGNLSQSTAYARFTTDPGWFGLAKAVSALANVPMSIGRVAADFDGDGYVDVAVATAQSQTAVRVLTGHGDGTFGAPRDFLDATSSSHELFAADLDGGGAELISIGSSELRQWHWDAPGQVTDKPMPAVPAGMALTNGAVMRMAADGQRLALVAEDMISGQRLLWRQPSPGVFAEPTALPARNSIYQHLVGAGDINGDGLDDLVYAGSEPGDMLVLLQQAGGSFAVGPAIAGLPNVALYRLVDFNRDGLTDIAYVTNAGGGVTAIGLLLQQPDHSFVAGPVLPVGCIGCDVQDFIAADLDRDGRVDFVVRSWSVVSFLRQNADGSFAAPDQYFGSGGYASLSVADFNGDGRLDVLAGADLLLQRPPSAAAASATNRRNLVQRLSGGAAATSARR